MKKQKFLKKNPITLIIIILVVLGGVYFISKGTSPEPEKEIIQCLKEKSKLYVQLGCHACERQKEILGESYRNLNVIDCFYEREKCIEKQISATPTWIINNKRYEGYKSIDELKKIANC